MITCGLCFNNYLLIINTAFCGDDKCSCDIGNHTNKSAKADYNGGKANNADINIKIFCDASANACNNFIFLDSVKLFIHNGSSLEIF